jgi:mRNA interferase MazF
MKVNRGEIWQVRLPFADGHEQSGERPVIIIQNDVFTQILPMVVVIPLTSAISAKRFPATLPIQPDGQNGLSIPSVALIFQVRSLDKRRFLRRIGCLDQNDMDQILKRLNKLTEN